MPPHGKQIEQDVASGKLDGLLQKHSPTFALARHESFEAHSVKALFGYALKRYPLTYQKHKPSLHRFSECTIKVATVVYTLESRKPRQIVRIDYMRIKVDIDGALDQEQNNDSFRLVANRVGRFLGEKPLASDSDRVVNAIEKFDERRWSQLHPQLPGPAHKRILEILFGFKHGR